MKILLWAGVAYCLLDFILGITRGRCYLPGLKCGTCRRGGSHRERG